MVEARHVDVLAADAAVVSRRRPDEYRQEAGDVQTNLLAEKSADHIGSVADAVRVALRLRVEEQARRVHAAGADDDDLRHRLALLAGPSIEILHAARKTVLVRQNARHDGIRANLEPPRTHREWQQVIRRTEERRRVAAGAAVAAVVAGRKTARRPRHVGAASGNDGDADLVHALFEQ